MTENDVIIQEFERLIQQIKIQIEQAPSKKDAIADQFRLKQIRNALVIIKNHPVKIKKGDDLKDIKGIGSGTIRRIDEILKTGRLSEIKIKKKEQKVTQQMEQLTEIIGIGPRKAHELITKYGITSVKQLKKAYEAGDVELTHSAEMGLKYYGIVQENIPRVEIDEVNRYIQGVVLKIDKNLRAVICGSYRRLKPTSGDIDIMLTHSKIKSRTQFETEDNYLLKLINKLKEDGFLIDDLTDKDPHEKYMGFAQWKKNPVRRIDIRYLPHNSYYTGLLYFTGSGSFNEKMRRLAIDLGYMLNEYGLYKVDEKGKKTRVQVTSEKDIFDELGMEFVPPEKR